jgi:Zn-dependent oligopeptidase
MTNEELVQSLIEEANALAERGNKLLNLSRQMNSSFNMNLYIDDDEKDKNQIDKLYDRVLMYVEWVESVTAKEITERFDLPTGYPSYEDRTMFAHIILHYLQSLGYLNCYKRDKEYAWLITEKGKKRIEFTKMFENNPSWEEIYF